MARSHYGYSVAQMEEVIRTHNENVTRRHEAARERGDDDECHLGLSAWAEGINFRLYSEERELAAKGWKAEFPALVDATTGAPVRARLAPTRFGIKWALVDEKDQFTGVFFANGDRAIAKRGYRKVMVLKPARAVIAGSGTGLSGCASAYVAVVEMSE